MAFKAKAGFCFLFVWFIGLSGERVHALEQQFQGVSFEEVLPADFTAEERKAVTESNSCAECPKLVLMTFLGGSFGQFKGVHEATGTALRTVNIPLLDFGTDAMIVFKHFQIGASVRLPTIIFIPAYEAVGVVIDKSIRLGRIKGLYVQGRYYRAFAGIPLETHDLTNGSIKFAQENIVGFDIGLRKIRSAKQAFEQGGGTSNTSLFFLRSLDGQWTNIGIRTNLSYSEKLKRQLN